jgi:hypothetical protein
VAGATGRGADVAGATGRGADVAAVSDVRCTGSWSRCLRLAAGTAPTKPCVCMPGWCGVWCLLHARPSVSCCRFHVVSYMLAHACGRHSTLQAVRHGCAAHSPLQPERPSGCMPVLMRSRRSCQCAHARGMRTLQLDPEGQLTRKPKQASLPTQRITQSSLQATVVDWHEESPVQ